MQTVLQNRNLRRMRIEVILLRDCSCMRDFVIVLTQSQKGADKRCWTEASYIKIGITKSYNYAKPDNGTDEPDKKAGAERYEGIAGRR